MQTNSTATTRATAPLSHLPLRLHHRAIVVRDQEVTRHFIEDILGIPLIATWCERIRMPEIDRDVEFCHTFFGLGDGSALAFFQFADPEVQQLCLPMEAPKVPRFDHIALKVDSRIQTEIIGRLEAAGVPYRITNHGYCKSVYVTSPDGLYLEFANDPPDQEEIDRTQRGSAHQELARWLAGRRESNNDYRQRDF